MAARRVTKTQKHEDGYIAALCHDGATWSQRSKARAIKDIDNKAHTCYTKSPDGRRAEVEVVEGKRATHLRTNWDGTRRNNLRDLHDC